MDVDVEVRVRRRDVEVEVRVAHRDVEVEVRIYLVDTSLGTSYEVRVHTAKTMSDVKVKYHAQTQRIQKSRKTKCSLWSDRSFLDTYCEKNECASLSINHTAKF